MGVCVGGKVEDEGGETGEEGKDDVRPQGPETQEQGGWVLGPWDRTTDPGSGHAWGEAVSPLPPMPPLEQQALG